MTSEEEKREARRQLKQKGWGKFFGDALRNEWKQNPTKAIFLFLLNATVMYLIIGVGAKGLNDDLRYCQIGNQETGDIYHDMKFKDSIKEWNNYVKEYNNNLSINPFARRIPIQYNLLNCTYQPKRWYAEKQEQWNEWRNNTTN